MIGVITLFAFAISAGLTRVLSHPSFRLRMLDHPNERSLHSVPTPRGGGVAIVSAILAMVIVQMLLHAQGPSIITWILVGALLIAGVSFLDDRFTIVPSYRLSVHFFAGVVLIFGGLTAKSLVLPGITWAWPAGLAIVASMLLILWLVNLYNFMDGMDGFAAGMTVIGFGVMAILGWSAKEPFFTGFNLVIAGSAAGFLVFNFPPARIFMGDVGSSTLGFLVAACILWASREGIFPVWIAIMIFSPFIVDATVTLVRRVLRRERIWEAHKSHYYQRLVELGWGHRKTVLWEYFLMVLCGLSAIIAMQLSVRYQWVVIMTWVTVYIILMLSVRRLETRKRLKI